MNIAISGATGFIGTYLSAYLTQKGHHVMPLKRKTFRNNDHLMEVIRQCEVIINLAGAPINHRWTSKYKKELYESRILTTRQIVNAINADTIPHLLISASAVGYYPSHGCYNEKTTKKGEGFLSDLCAEWEREALRVSSGTRLAITRFGIVLSPEGGAFPQMARPAKAGIAAIIGSGTAPFSWIDLRDLAQAMEFIINNGTLNGVFNFTAPQKLTQQGFTRQIARHYQSKITMRIPKAIFRLRYGKASEFVTKGQCAVPKRLLESGFQFNSPDIQQFLSRMP